MARFYVDGYEIDVQDPTFFLSEQQAIDINDNIAAYLSDYA